MTHGATVLGSWTPEYRAWRHIKDRCGNPFSGDFKWYGARGIKVCARWDNDFRLFLADMGPRPSSKHSIDRYPDNNGDYEPGNCRWATAKQQANNRRTSKSARAVESNPDRREQPTASV